MFSALFSFLGGSVFRMIWGEVAGFVQKRQDHAHELEMLKVQSDIEDKRAQLQMEQVKLQHDLGIKEIQVAGDMAIAKSEADGFLEAMKSAARPIGIAWVDAWNGCVRPSAATIALLLWLFEIIAAGFIMQDWDRELVGVILGFYFADRSLGKRGK